MDTDNMKMQIKLIDEIAVDLVQAGPVLFAAETPLQLPDQFSL